MFLHYKYLAQNPVFPITTVLIWYDNKPNRSLEAKFNLVNTLIVVLGVKKI